MIDRFLLSFANARTFLSKLWVLARPYWFAEERQSIGWRGYTVTVKESWIARGLLAVIVLLTIFIVYMSKLINAWNARFFNALQDKNADAFWFELKYWVVLVALFIIAFVYRFWLQQLLTIRWRRWLSEVYFRDWLADRTYYRMELVSQGTDNPEQRIEQDCANFTERTLAILLGLLLQVMTLITFASVLWDLSGSFVLPIFGGITIPGYMMWAAVLYAVVGSLATYLIGRPLVRINFELERYNADFRYRMVRIRENAESIALYRGEPDEERRLRSAFGRIFDTWWSLMTYTKRLTWLTSFYGQAAAIFPYIVAAPQYFAGQIPLGVLTQTADAFAQVQGALSWFVDTYPRLADWKAGVDRLTTFSEAMLKAKEEAAKTAFEADRGQGRRAHLARCRGAAAQRRLAAGKRRSDGASGPIASRRRSLRQRQDHALSRARRPLAVRPRPRGAAAGRPHAVPAAKALSADRHAQGGAELSRGARRPCRRGLPRGLAGVRARPSAAPARGGRQLVAGAVGGRAAAARFRPRAALPPELAVPGRGDLGAGRGGRAAHVRAARPAPARRDPDQHRPQARGRCPARAQARDRPGAPSRREQRRGLASGINGARSVKLARRVPSPLDGEGLGVG